MVETPTRKAEDYRCEAASEAAACRHNLCAWQGCSAPGEYRAPKDRTLLHYLLFCLEHVRAYNAGWDFHAGYSAQELEAEIRSAATWERPTWKLGTLGAGARTGRARINDPFGFAAGTGFEDRAKAGAEKAESTPEGAARTRALKVFDLSAPVTAETLKRRYKDLVKKHHPDANGGSREAEKRMKIINEAYQTLRASLAAAT